VKRIAMVTANAYLAYAIVTSDLKGNHVANRKHARITVTQMEIVSLVNAFVMKITPAKIAH
jgi:hypothetical protein